MSFFANILNDIDLGSNWLLILVFLGVSFGYGILVGRNKLNLITLATYFSLIIVKSVPWSKLGFLGIEEAPKTNVQVFLFLAIILGIFFLAPHSGLVSFMRISGRGRGNFLQLAILGFLSLGLLLSAVVSFLPVKTIDSLNPLLLNFFAKEEAKFLWLLLPMLALLFLKRRRSYGQYEE